MSRFIPHAPFAPVQASLEDAAKWRLLRLQPRPEARAAGIRAYDAGAPLSENPHAALTAEWASWWAGWEQRFREEYK